jgi:hypothetical protein
MSKASDLNDKVSFKLVLIVDSQMFEAILLRSRD